MWQTRSAGTEVYWTEVYWSILKYRSILKSTSINISISITTIILLTIIGFLLSVIQPPLEYMAPTYTCTGVNF